MIDQFNMEYLEGQKTAYEDVKGLNQVLWKCDFYDTIAKQKIDVYANMRLKQIDNMQELAIKMMEELSNE